MIVLAGKSKNLSKRYYAIVIDYMILFVLLAMAMYFLGEKNDSGGYTVRGFRAFIIPLIWLFYFPLCESLTKQTLGKKALNLYVVDFKGESPSIVQTFLRRALDPIELLFLGAPALLSINHSAKNQRVGDMIAGTLVVSTEAACRFCGAELELNTREVVNRVFHCPRCNTIN
jgi:uncharacterized RDD family membrane protein YckC